MKRKLPPAALLIALVLACSAGAASAATTASLGSSFGYMAEVVMACVSGSAPACMAASGGSGTVSPENAVLPASRTLDHVLRSGEARQRAFPSTGIAKRILQGES